VKVNFEHIQEVLKRQTALRCLQALKELPWTLLRVSGKVNSRDLFWKYNGVSNKIIYILFDKYIDSKPLLSWSLKLAAENGTPVF